MDDGSQGTALAARLEAVESRIAITELIHRYALNVRRGNGQDNADLFTEDGAFEMRRGTARDAGVAYRRLEGRDAIRQHLMQDMPLLPLIHNIMIKIDGDRATGTSALVTTMLGTPHRIMAEYRDTYRREAGAWRFAERISILFENGSSAPAPVDDPRKAP